MTDPAAVSSPRASVVIVAKRDRPLLRTCLERLAAHASAVPFETVVVLNGAPQTEAEQLELALTGSAKVLGCAVHLGLAGALNRARPITRGEFLVSAATRQELI